VNAPMDAGLAEALATLGLRSDADARSVKRAYAQQVKQIDQATQLQAFQTLREAYELALAVISRQEAKARDEAPTPAPALAPTLVPTAVAEPVQPPMPAATADFAPPDSGDMARAVFQGFAARADAGFKEEAEATAALQDALADDRLLNLEARALFELQVAHRIMGGWQPGHEFLFGPACEVFHWESDRSHLRVFGQLGAGLDAAINEKLIFFRQSPKDFEQQRNVIRRLRQAETPSVKQRRADLSTVQMLVQRHPHWLRIVTSQANINSWFNDLPEPELATTQNERTQVSQTSQRHWKPTTKLAPWWLFVLALVLALGKLLSPAPGERHGRPSTSWSSGEPAGVRYTNSWPSPVGAGQTTSPTFELGSVSQKPLYELRPNVQSRDAGRPAASARPVNVDAVDQALQASTSITPPLTTTPKPLPAATSDSATSVNEEAAQKTLPANAAPPPEVLPSPAEESARMGHVRLVLRDGHIIVDEVGQRSTYSHGTLQRGDRLMSCMGGAPLTAPADAWRCVSTINVKAETGATPYMFRVLRYGQIVPASLTLGDPSTLPSPKPTLQFSSPG